MHFLGTAPELLLGFFRCCFWNSLKSVYGILLGYLVPFRLVVAWHSKRSLRNQEILLKFLQDLHIPAEIPTRLLHGFFL